MKTVLLSTLALIAPVAAAAQTPAPAPSAAPTGAAPATGATVFDAQGGEVGTIDQVTATVVVINTGTNKVGVPPSSLGTSPKGPTLGMTKAELDAAYQAQQGQAAAQLKAKLVAGSMVHGMGGAMLGTVKAADDQFVTVTTPKGDVRLPVSGFGIGADGALALGMTAAQLDAAMAPAAK